MPYLKTTKRGWQGAANGLPTHLAGGTSRLIISLKRYLVSLFLAFYTDALSIIYTLFVFVINIDQSISAMRCVVLSMCPVPVFCPQTVHSHNPSSHQSHNTHMIVTSSSSSSSTTPHRVVNQQGYDGMMSKGGQYQPGMPLSVVPSGGPGQYQGNMPQGTLVCGICEMLWRLNRVKLSSSLMLLWIKSCRDASL